MNEPTSISTESNTTKAHPLVLKVVPFICLLVGGIVGYNGITGVLHARASMSWPTTEARIVSSTIDRHRSRSTNRGTRTSYHANVLYEFSVDGITYAGNRVAYGDHGSSNSLHANRITNRYPEDSIVTVHYSPGNPEECLLEPGIKAQSLLVPTFGVIVFIAGLSMVLFPSKSKQDSHTPEYPDGDYLDADRVIS